MLDWLWLIPTFPLAGFLILTLTAGRLPKPVVFIVAVGSVGLSALLSALLGYEFLGSPPESHFYRQILWRWISVGDLTPNIALYLDGLSLVWLGVITGVGFLIHLYSVGFMADDPGCSWFFAYLNLFIFSMTTLVLADNLLLLFLGWEGVGLCSYLLIGFWYQEPANGLAARKAFVVTRAGDTAMMIGLLLLFLQLGTLDIQPLMQRASEQWTAGGTLATLAALLLLGGAVGKSAQFPLQTWLPDAMAGPTPISALIHAATMVTAGVYLIARTHVLFTLAPDIQFLVAVIGATTLLMAGFSSLMQTDIKRIIAYSTISQIGYMMLGLGVGAWTAGVFHVVTHAFFKSLLFLAAGGVIYCFHHEHNIFKMGGLRKRLPITFWSFMAGGAALSALPFTSGHYSKDEILLTAYSVGASGPFFWAAGVVGALLTAMYTFRLIFIVFFGSDERTKTVEESFGISMAAVLMVLSVLALFGGLLKLPLHDVLHSVFADTEQATSVGWVGLVTTLIPFLGILIVYLFYTARTFSADALVQTGIGRALNRFWYSDWGMDWLYDKAFVQPYKRLAAINKSDIVDAPYKGIVVLSRYCYHAVSRTQTGQLRWYAAGMMVGVVVFIAVGVLS